MKATFLFLIALTLFSYDISPEFSGYLDSIPDSEHLSAILHFDARPVFPDQIGRDAGIELLKNFSDSIYAPVIGILAEETRTGTIHYRTGWLTPSILIKGRKDVLLALIDQITPDAVVWNREYQMLHEADEISEELEIAWGVNQIGSPAVWAEGFTGEGVTVGVFDTGIRYTHHDIENRMWTNPGEIPDNDTDDDGNGYVDDYFGYDFVNSDGDPWDDNNWTWHGTHCAGTVAGDGSSGTQTGVAPGANVAALKVINSTGTGVPADVQEALEYATDMGLDIFTMSIGWEDPSESLSNFFRAIFENLLELGIIVSVSAGNGASSGGHYTPPQDISAPADCPSPWYGSAGHTAVIAVGATNYEDDIASFSSYGPTAWTTSPYDDYPSLIKPDVTAPGVAVTSLSGYNDYSYRGAGGTSMACPHVAGACALLLSKAPYLTPRQVDSLLQTTALDLGDAGRDNYYGNGRIQIDLAVDAAPAPPYPLVSYLSHTISDPLGNDNGIADVSESFGLVITLKNRGLELANINCVVSTASPYIVLTDNTSLYGTLTTNESGDNSSDPYQMSVDPTTLPGTAVMVFLYITGDGGYSTYDTLTFNIANYPRTYYDLPFGSGNVLTVTNFGSVGFFDPTASSPLGSGFEYGGYNYLYGSYLFLGLPGDVVRTGEDGTGSDFIPISNMDDSFAMYGDNEVFSKFIDTESGLLFYQQAISWNSAPNNDFVILRYQIENISETSVSYTLGLYADYDITYTSEDGWLDRASYSSGNGWGYMWDNSAAPEHSAIVGIAGLELMPYGSIINNAYYVYPEGLGWTDGVKSDFLDGTYSFTFADTDSDWSVIVSNGPKTLPPGELDTVVFIMAAGSSGTDFGNNIAQARSMTGTILGTDEQEFPDRQMLHASPNPFNSSVEISLPRSETGGRITILDISGREISEVKLSSTQQTFIWNAPDEPSGIYLFRLSLSDGKTYVTKALMVR